MNNPRGNTIQGWVGASRKPSRRDVSSSWVSFLNPAYGPNTGKVVDVELSQGTNTGRQPGRVRCADAQGTGPHSGPYLAEHTNDVALLLIDESDNVHINEDALAFLKKFWRGTYKNNLNLLIPDMAEQLDAGYLYTAGIKTSIEGKFLA